jgi:hypothetical protein
MMCLVGSRLQLKGLCGQFHISWNGTTLDWECFDSREEAAERAIFLKQEGETFKVEEVRTEECPLRASMSSQHQ